MYKQLFNAAVGQDGAEFNYLGCCCVVKSITSRAEVISLLIS